mmetsp:Transcript_21944/g.40863  ORF Transcript_21944/g.40863 Transcript_21944/m.40863 type:complete len:268 (+) Transcript_21944:159-962(+)
MDGTSDLGEDGDDPGLLDIGGTIYAEEFYWHDNGETSIDGGDSDEESSGELAENACWIGLEAVALSHEGVEQLSTCKAFLEFYFTNWRNEKSNWEGVRDDEEWMKRMLVFLETLIRLRGDAQGFLLQRLRGVFADFVAHTYPALVNLKKKKKLKKAIKLVIRSYKTLKVSEGFLSFESSARRAPSAFQACNRDTIKNKTLEALKNNTEHVETQPSVITLTAGRSGASFSLCLEQKNASSSDGLIADNLSRISEVAEMDDLTLAAAAC